MKKRNLLKQKLKSLKKKRKLTDMSQFTTVPIEAIPTAFASLQSKGWIFSKAPNAEESFSDNYPVRPANHPPFNKAPISSLSLGPFCLSRDEYENLYINAKSELGNDAWKLLLVFKRIQYEKLGVSVDGYKFQLSDEPMSKMLSLIDFWDIENPIVFDSFVWVEPNDKAKKLAEEVCKIKFPDNSFKWWDVMIDFGKEFVPTLPSNYPSEFIYVPDVFNLWQRYLPDDFLIFLHHLCRELRSGKECEFLTIKSSTELMGIIERIFAKLEEYSKDGETYFLDRRILIKELYDYNSFSYPYNSNSAFDFLLQISFVKMKKIGSTVEYYLNTNPPRPKRVIKFPINWEKRMNEFLKTGSVLFAYLSVEEILSE